MPAFADGGVIVRPARPGDYPAVARLHRLAAELHAAAEPHLFRLPPGETYDPARYAADLDNPDLGLFVADCSGDIAGMVRVVLGEAPPIPIMAPRRIGRVDDLMVNGEHRREGIGRALMDHAADWARDRGAGDLELTVYAFNEAAMAFYRALGYRVIHSRMLKS